jgi:exodeoxyribonuclease-5
MSIQNNILDFLHFDCPTIEQRNALLAMQTFVQNENIDDILILCGAAGTGKSSITTALIGYLNEQDIKYKIAAPTGRAARLLGRKSNTFACTIHSMIYKVTSNTESGEIIFTTKIMDDADLHVFVIDEASMINAEIANNDQSLFKTDNSLLKDLLAYVKSGNKNNKIVFLGDRNQLPPVNEKESLALVPAYLMENYKMKCSLHLLTEVKRQEDGSYILKEATKIREAIDNKINRVDWSQYVSSSYAL